MLVEVLIRSPYHSKLGPHWVPILNKIGSPWHLGAVELQGAQGRQDGHGGKGVHGGQGGKGGQGGHCPLDSFIVPHISSQTVSDLCEQIFTPVPCFMLG